MAISRRLRFEILRRDGHTCRYCGAMAPDVPMTVDHVIPTTLGGSDEPDNLVTACQDCNAGKSSVAPDSPVVQDVTDDAMRWRRAMELAAAQVDRESGDRVLLEDRWLKAWNDASRSVYTAPLPDAWRESIARFLSLGLSIEWLCDRAERVNANRNLFRADAFRYFCGCCWRQISEIQDRAQRLIESEDAQSGKN